MHKKLNKQQKKQSFLSSVPSVHEILDLHEIKKLISKVGQQVVSNVVRMTQEEYRHSLIEGNKKQFGKLEKSLFVDRVIEKALVESQRSIRPIINLSGTILHTNLGRALLPHQSIEAMVEVASQTSNLEYNIEEGSRDNRDKHIEEDLCHFTGAEAATVVNNNAAALMLILNSLARRKDVLISRGELIEIGGSFRLPDIMKSSGCKLKEVGTTNRTHIEDFVENIDSKTGLILKAYTSNYTISGFTSGVRESDLIKVSKNRNVPFVVDLGSGSLVKLSNSFLKIEPTPLKKIKMGADLITFSGDKLVGGPQCGIIVGRKELINKINKNAMKRAMRCDKLTIAALSEILKLYKNPDTVVENIPTLRQIFRPKKEIRILADRLLPLVQSNFNQRFVAEVVCCESQVGSGSLPNKTIPSVGISIRLKSKSLPKSGLLKKLSKAFRELPVPILGRVSGGSFVLDLRCLETEDIFIKQLEYFPSYWKK